MVKNFTPLVSIIIPTYNHALFLQRALESIISQSYENWEVLIINNFSKDNTIEIVRAFNEPRFKLINFSNNGIIAASRNEGIRKANGVFVAFLDSDDFWYFNKIEKCMKAFSDTSADLVTHHLISNIEGKLGKILKNGPVQFFNYNSLLFLGNCLTNSSVVVRRSCLNEVGNLNESMKIITAEDYDLWLRLARANYKFSLVDCALGEYFIHSINNSSAIEKHLNSVSNVFFIHFENYVHSSRFIKAIRFRRRMGIIYYGAARQATFQFKHFEAFKYFKKSLISYPFRLKAYGGIIFLIVSIFRQRKNAN